MDSSKLKDLVVTLLIEESAKSGNEFTFDAGATPIKEHTLEDVERVLQALAQDRFIKCEPLMSNNYLITLNQSIFDLRERGGFSMQIEILKLKYDVLQLEVDKLEKEESEKSKKAITIIRDILEILEPLINVVTNITK
jgi:hypothetical protein